MAFRASDSSEEDVGILPATLALARQDPVFMAKWTAIEPKPRSYNKKVPNQYSSKLRKLPHGQLHYALLDAQEYWIEILANHFPPAWVSAADVLQHLATIVPMASAASTKPYHTLKAVLKKATHAGTHAGWKDDANLRCQPVPLGLLYAVKVNGSAQKGAGDMPPKITEDLAAAKLDWLIQDPSTSVIPRCWRTWAIRHNYPHAAYISHQQAPAQPVQNRISVHRTSARSPSQFEDRMSIKGIPRRFSVPRPTSPELGYGRHERNEHYGDHDGMLIEDDESFELWDASFRDEELQEASPEPKPDLEFDDPPTRTLRHAQSLRSPSPAESDNYRAITPPVDFGHVQSAAAHRRAPVASTKTDQQANVFDIKSMDDVRTLLTDLRSQKPLRCPTAAEVLPDASSDVHEAFATYTRYLGAKVKAAMKLTLGQILLASPLAKLVKQTDAMRRDLDYYRNEAESVRQQLPEAIQTVKEVHQREVTRLHKDIANLKSAVSKTARQQASRKPQLQPEASTSQYHITTRAAATRTGGSVAGRRDGGRLDAPPAMSTRSRQVHGGPRVGQISRKRQSIQHQEVSAPPRKRVATGKKSADLKTVYATYFADDE
ncbi:hypothetical protein Micbo1qcDRAFT_208071 [Microdochium bolleyi]|uniref:Uncharacterized protein n=1 Tax=Microdochium bolleyi TaxID=196109 RepID=A0A136IR92_9PEZI|nr:hypothetical protein Micbo1qcDRAFT_208071 [Microdochium bolleyi]